MPSASRAPGSDLQVVVVGGGPAGLATALSLLHHAPELRGRVVVLEKATYPREKVCAGGLGDRGWRVLEALDAVPEVPAVRIHAIRVTTARGGAFARPGPALGRVVRRVEFDAALAEIARARGVIVQQGVAVRGLVEDAEGVTLDTSAGPWRAAVVVGADGVGSRVRRSLGLHAGGLRAVVLEVDTPVTPSDGARDVLHFDGRWPDLPGYVWDFPTLVDGEPLVCRGVYVLRARAGEVPGLSPEQGEVDVAAHLEACLAERGLSLADCRQKRFGERGYEPRTRVVQGRRLLVGEAAGIDPFSGEGIPQALEGGHLLGRFLAAAPWTPASLVRWQDLFAGSRLALDLGVRHRVLGQIYGGDRAATEAALAGDHALLAAGCRHWAGLPQPWLSLAGTLLGAGWRRLRATP